MVCELTLFLDLRRKYQTRFRHSWGLWGAFTGGSTNTTGVTVINKGWEALRDRAQWAADLQGRWEVGP